MKKIILVIFLLFLGINQASACCGGLDFRNDKAKFETIPGIFIGKVKFVLIEKKSEPGYKYMDYEFIKVKYSIIDGIKGETKLKEIGANESFYSGMGGLDCSFGTSKYDMKKGDYVILYFDEKNDLIAAVNKKSKINAYFSIYFTKFNYLIYSILIIIVFYILFYKLRFRKFSLLITYLLLFSLFIYYSITVELIEKFNLGDFSINDKDSFLLNYYLEMLILIFIMIIVFSIIMGIIYLVNKKKKGKK